MGRETELAREVARLRQENARLSRLLQLRGSEATPAAEQPAIPVVAPGLVTKWSPTQHKLALYADRFAARRDVYAVRWENARSGKKGWSPAVPGGWWNRGRGGTTYLQLTAKVLEQHLRADDKENLFIGLYPLFEDNTCRFLAADFDGPAAMLDALAYIKSAHSRGVPTALELSQSGRGAHVWTLFSGPVPAATARAIGTGLVHEAMTLRGSMDLRSYDRLFPNQDVMPDGGFGNLIAAPLQGQRRLDGLTVFLDLATLEPYPDQWQYLSTLDRMTPAEAERMARSGKPPIGSGVERLERSAASAIHPPLSAKIDATLGAGLSIDMTQLSPAALSTLKHAASMANPKFYELQRLRKWTGDTPRFIRGYDLTLDEQIVLPRGLRHRISDLLGRAGTRLEIADERIAGQEINVTLTAQLDERQSSAVGGLLAHDDGILVAPPGSGKTVMACAMIAERGTSTLILVDRKALAEQWRDRIQQFLRVKAGQLGGGRKKLTGVVDVAMLPSLARRDDIAALTNGYGQIIVDECHHLGAAAYDHSVKPVAAHYWLGLTATPARRDGLGEVVTWQLGPVRHTFGAEPPHGTLLDGPGARGRVHCVLHLHETSFAFGEVDLTEPGAIAEVHRVLVEDSERNAQLVDDIDAAVRRGRNCLVLARRINHVERLIEALVDRGREPLVLRGGMPAKERRAIVEKLSEARAGSGVLVIGTTPFVGEGFDAPALDTLFLAGPISFDGLLTQCAGRIVRSSPGKSLAEVHDYHDIATPILANSLQRRMPGYRKLGFVWASSGKPV
ncbi:MAG: DEAD/DEAH box helicase family protein [Tessaracoccus sp.]